MKAARHLRLEERQGSRNYQLWTKPSFDGRSRRSRGAIRTRNPMPRPSKRHLCTQCGPKVLGLFMLPTHPVMAIPDLFKGRVRPQVLLSCDTGFILDRLFGFRSRMSSPDSSLVPMVFAGYTRSHANLASEIQIYMFSSGMRITSLGTFWPVQISGY